ncbi:hypothetical protein QQF64_029029 [Cirrhinus molitorella]|uniref:Uncharacterized protein n=1 Tax=Cirrhinus molitorella TaxID=172907 RepID=A0ABR3N885_9TELE
MRTAISFTSGLGCTRTHFDRHPSSHMHFVQSHAHYLVFVRGEGGDDSDGPASLPCDGIRLMHSSKSSGTITQNGLPPTSLCA